MESVDEQVIQLRGDEQEGEGEVFLGEQDTELFTSDTPPAADVVDEVIGTLDAENLPSAVDAIAQAVETLDADRAGDAAKPQYQPSIPGILPPFDWRRAQLTTESLESNVASAEDAWDAAKDEAASCKKTFDKAVEQLREHIQATHRARIDAEYQHGTGDGPIAPLHEATATVTACWTEQKTGRPCSICRNLASAPTNGETAQHVAAAAAIDANAGTLDAFGMAASIAAVTGVIIASEELSLWDRDDFKAVARYLEETAAIAANDDADLGDVIRPEILGRPHQIGEDGNCRVCGATVPGIVVSEITVGQLVGLDCAGEAAEPSPKATPRHRKPADRQKAKQARGSKDHSAEQKVEGRKKAAGEKKTATKGKGRSLAAQFRVLIDQIRLLGGALDLCFGFAVAGLAQRQEVGQVVCRDVVAREQAVRPDVVNVPSWQPAMLAGVGVAASRLSLLRLPVRSSVSGVAVDVLRMLRPDPVSVTAWPRAVLTFAGRSDVTRRTHEARPAADADQRDRAAKFGGDGDVLALLGARPAAPEFQSRRPHFEGITARLTVNVNAPSRHGHALYFTVAA